MRPRFQRDVSDFMLPFCVPISFLVIRVLLSYMGASSVECPIALKLSEKM
jgi:hypothetical protein